jgi:hypothetical protein
MTASSNRTKRYLVYRMEVGVSDGKAMRRRFGLRIAALADRSGLSVEVLAARATLSVQRIKDHGRDVRLRDVTRDDAAF